MRGYAIIIPLLVVGADLALFLMLHEAIEAVLARGAPTWPELSWAALVLIMHILVGRHLIHVWRKLHRGSPSIEGRRQKPGRVVEVSTKSEWHVTETKEVRMPGMAGHLHTRREFLAKATVVLFIKVGDDD